MRREREARARQPVLLVLRALGLGDLLTAVPSLRALAAASRGHRVVLAAPRALAPLAMHTGAVDAVVDAAPLAPLRIGPLRPDVAVNLHGRGPQSHRMLLATRPRRLIAFSHPDVPESAGGATWRADEHEVARWCRLLAGAGIASDPADLELAPPAVRPPQDARGATLLHPGAKDAARRWPAERWAAVARAELRAGRSVLLTGDQREAELAHDVARRAGLPARAVVAGRTDLLGLAAAVADAERVVCGDTGVAHLATALRTPSVVLFGPVAPACWGPPADRPWHRALWKGRVGDPHATAPDAGLLEIGVDEVVAALADLPEKRASLRAVRAGSGA
ncbi:MAG: glycosyltransferase family 9 protein [Thermodesulfobacteriota bacterium]